LHSPRRRSRLTSARVAGRAVAAGDAAGDRPVHTGTDDPAIYKAAGSAEFLNACPRVAKASPGTKM
ncbi:MAG: hypothetical protein JW839_21545, partial [Candidatus Lokiarchaeota archaeon]|nr:hypothetical protein [Candidatus Lokiarchaeota archaeon]